MEIEGINDVLTAIRSRLYALNDFGMVELVVLS